MVPVKPTPIAFDYPPQHERWRYDSTGSGRPIINENQIEAVAMGLLEKYAPDRLIHPGPVPMQDIFDAVKEETQLREVRIPMPEVEGDLRGVTRFSVREIVLDESLFTDPTRAQYWRFTVAHELGHWILQRHRPIYLSPGDPSTEMPDYIENFRPKKTLESVKDWVEWQANHFASCLILPERALRKGVYTINTEQFMTSPAKSRRIYINITPQGRADTRARIQTVAELFGVSPYQV